MTERRSFTELSTLPMICVVVAISPCRLAIAASSRVASAYCESALRLVEPGGLIILDNMLRRGRVADPNENDADTNALRRLNAKIAADRRVDSALLPIASGMTLARRR